VVARHDDAHEREQRLCNQRKSRRSGNLRALQLLPSRAEAASASRRSL
jgi:hypothetical protein